MSKIKILTPVHIGNGNKYPNYLISENKKYNFDALLNKVLNKNSKIILSDDFLKKLTSPSKDDGSTKQEMAKVFSLNKDELKDVKVDYFANVLTPKLNQLDINEQIKTLNGVLIPGSSLKGYIMNVIMYHVIKHNLEIQQFYKTNLSTPNIINKLELEVSTLTNQRLICRDIVFPLKVDIKLISRITKKGSMPIIYECIPNDSYFDGEIIKVVNKKSINNIENHLSKKLANEINKILDNLKEKFSEMNKEFMLNVIKYEKDFVSKSKVKQVDKDEIITQLSKYEELLKQNKIIIQLGKNTNYIVKSIGHAYPEDFYKNNFYKYFNPGMAKGDKNNKIAKPFVIGSMNLVSQSNYENYVEVPGYIEIIW